MLDPNGNKIMILSARSNLMLMVLAITMSSAIASKQVQSQTPNSESTLPAASRGPSENRDTEQKIRELIQKLGDPKFSVRQQASKELWQLGRQSESFLRKAAQSRNAEVSARAKAILADFDYGIYPSTDSSTRSLIISFRDGDLNQKKATGQKLMANGLAVTLIKLILKEEDPIRLAPIVRDIFGSNRFARQLIEQGNEQAALETFRMLNQNFDKLRLEKFRREELRSSYLWLATELGLLRSELKRWEQSSTGTLEPSDLILQLRICRAMGNVMGSLSVAGQMDSDQAEPLTTQLLAEQHQWNQLSDVYWKPDRKVITELELPELLSGLTFHRLAGNQARFEADLKTLYGFSDPLFDEFALDAASGLFEKVTNTSLFMICEFLLTNHQVDKGLSYLSKIDKFKAFEAYVSVDDYPRAFKVLGFADISPATAKIFERQIRAYRPVRWSDSTEDIEQLSNVVYAFYQLGFLEEAKSLYRTLYSIATRYEANQTGALGVVCQSMLSNDQKELFFELVESQLQQKNFDFAIESLFGNLPGEVDGVSLASFWWTVIEDEYSKRKPLDRLKLLDQFLRPLLPGEKPTDEFKNLVGKIEKELSEDNGSWGDEAFLGYTYLLWNDREKAKFWLSRYQLESSPLSDVAMDLGNLYFEDEQFDLAAQTYFKAWKFGDRKTSGLYLAGVAQRKLGKIDKSKQTIALAKKLMLGSEDNQQVVITLLDRKLEADARPILRSAMRVGQVQSWDVGTARFRYINLLEEKEGKLAANLLENQLIDVVKTLRYYPSLSSYTYFPMEVQLRNFDAHIVNQSVDLAVESVRKALQIRPCSATIAEDYLPKLRKLKGGEKPADELFNSIRQGHLDRLAMFPNSGLYNNNLAWISTTYGKNLDEALKHAELAVRNEPTNPTYMDTLADVCFNLGQVDRAITLMEKCLRLNPRSEHYNEQMKRFKNKENENDKK